MCSTASTPLGQDDASQSGDRSNRVFKVFHSIRNVFGLSRRFYSTELSSHDPDNATTSTDLWATVDPATIPGEEATNYHPYPNKESLLLGDWFWSDGIQKSQDSFKRLLDIVGDPEYTPSHVRDTDWTRINSILGSSEPDGEWEWMDADAGWVSTPVVISVPFHSRTGNPGVHSYCGAKLYHRSLIKVIKEKVVHSAEQFHYEPYDLFWTSPVTENEPVRVHGELYTSSTFLQAHRELQDSPGEPGCNLQRVVVALMFWSDATQLMSFGNAKLWPCYLFFGNESKYWRCRPSCNLCCHVAYFKDASILFFELFRG